MAKIQAPKSDLVNTQAAIVDTIAIPESKQVAPFNLNEFFTIMSDMAQTDFTIDNYNKTFTRLTEDAVIAGTLNPTVKMLLDFGFKRAFSVHNAAIPSMTDNTAKTEHIRLVEKYWSLSVMNKTDYDKIFKAPAVSSGKGKSKNTEAVVDYSPLVSELKLMLNSVEYNAMQAEDIQVIINGLTITATNTAVQAKEFYDVLIESDDLADLQVYIKTALSAYAERTAAAAAAEKAKAEREESERKAAILARFKRG